jgi:predicted MPP superfamily phosphohydrolase
VPRFLSFTVFLTVVLVILGGMHGYLWLRLIRDPGLPDTWRRLATALLVLLALSVPLGMFAVRLGSGWVARVLPAAAFAWLGIAFVLFCVVAAMDLARLSVELAAVFGDWLRRTPEPPADPSRRLFVARTVAGGAVTAAGGATAWALRSATGPAEIHEVPVRLERLPPALSGLVLAQISDLHVGPSLRERTVRRVVEQTNALRPDVIAITGDLVDGSVPELRSAVSELARLRARHGVFFVTGNHDYYSGADEWVAELRRLGIRVLRNERVQIGDRGASIDLAGVEDWSASRGAHGLTLERALAGRDPDRSLVLLAHQPRGVGDAVRAGVELQLSGHTHGGQIVPFNLLVAAAYPYVKGLHTHVEGDRRGQIFVSKGTGFWGPPMRLGVPPEIAKIVLV